MNPEPAHANAHLEVPAFQSRWRLKGDRSHVFIVPYANRDGVWIHREGVGPGGRSYPTKRVPLAEFHELHEPEQRADAGEVHT